MPKVRYFEVTADDPERAVRFYSEVFGWFAEKWQEAAYWQISAGEEDEPGVSGAVRPRLDGATGTIDVIDVSDLDAALERVVAAGGRVVQARQTIPFQGYTAYCADTEGNVFGLIQYDPEARPGE